MYFYNIIYKYVHISIAFITINGISSIDNITTCKKIIVYLNKLYHFLKIN